MANQRQLVETCADFSIKSFSRQIPAMVVFMGTPIMDDCESPGLECISHLFDLRVALLGTAWPAMDAAKRILAAFPAWAARCM